MIKIGVLGTGYVGLVTGTCLAELGMKVTCIDNDQNKIQKLLNGIIPIYEPGLEELVKKNCSANRLFFTHHLKNIIDEVDIIFIAVGTPPGEDGTPNLYYLEEAIEEIKNSLKKELVLVIKSTVPVGTNNSITKSLANASYKCHVVSNPEFLREGHAIKDFMEPSRLIIGTNSTSAISSMKMIYSYFIEAKVPFICTTPETAELSKYAANGFLATKIAFINEIANLCEHFGADVMEVSHAMGLDERIGSQFLQAGPGFGGSCFPKDIMALNTMNKELKIKNYIVESVINSNNARKKLLAAKIIDMAQDKIIACLGLTFKAGTDDVRESPALDVIQELLSYNLQLRLYDPSGCDNAKTVINSPKIFWANDIEQALEGCEVIVILTEWLEFKNLDFAKLKLQMLDPVIIDLRNLLDKEYLIKLGFKYYGVGR